MKAQANPISGGGCTNAAIKSLIATRKASFKPGPVPEVEKEEVPKVAKKRKAKAVAAKPAKTRKVTKKGKKAVQDSDDGDDENGYDEEKAGIVTPPSSGPKGESPRKATTVKSEHEHDEYDGLLDDAQSAKDSSSVENDTADGEFDPFAE